MPRLRPRTCHGVLVIDARYDAQDGLGLRTVTIEIKPTKDGEWQVWGWDQPPQIIPYRADWKDEPRFKEHRHDGAIDPH
jgi:hypothetical protein